MSSKETNTPVTAEEMNAIRQEFYDKFGIFAHKRKMWVPEKCHPMGKELFDFFVPHFASLQQELKQAKEENESYREANERLKEALAELRDFYTKVTGLPAVKANAALQNWKKGDKTNG